jgi:WD40 repeat protein
MSVMLTKFESKSNRVKGVSPPPAVDRAQRAHLPQGSRSIRRSRSSPRPCSMERSSSGTTAWASSSIDSRSMMVSRRAARRVCAQSAHLRPGPVRAVAFHPSRPLLATGGDDFKIKIWGVFRYPALCAQGLTRCTRPQAPEPPVLVHPSWAFGLRPDAIVPPRNAVDCKLGSSIHTYSMPLTSCSPDLGL